MGEFSTAAVMGGGRARRVRRTRRALGGRVAKLGDLWRTAPCRRWTATPDLRLDGTQPRLVRGVACCSTPEEGALALSLAVLIATPGPATEAPVEESGPALQRPSAPLQYMSGSRCRAPSTLGPWPSETATPLGAAGTDVHSWEVQSC